MQTIIQWAGSRGHWTHSGFVGLPAVQNEADMEVQQWQVITGGLALVLSRLSATERSARFHATSRLYRGLRRRLRQGLPVDARTELLSDVMHEIAEVADRLTIHCLRACFDARLNGSAEPAVSDTGFDTRPTSHMQLHTQSSQSTGGPSGWHPTAPADLVPDLLVRRARALRSTLAAARMSQQEPGDR